MLRSFIKAIAYHLPEKVDENDKNDRLIKKIGIEQKHIVNNNEFASDLAYHAAMKLLNSGGIEKESIDFLLYCTQSPDYFLPTTACLLQERLGLSKSIGALDFNLGCSGYVYGLSLAKGLIESGSAKNVLLLTADTYSKFINKNDKTVRVLFGDGAAATLISVTEDSNNNIGPFVFGTDGSGAENLIVPAGGLREPISPSSFEESVDDYGNKRSRKNLYMNGSEIFSFASREVPAVINRLMDKENTSIDDYDYFVFHQANMYMMENLRRKLNIPKEKFSIQLKDCGNTVSSSIPIALYRDFIEGNIKNGDKVMLIGFGVGYSWAACSVDIKL